MPIQAVIFDMDGLMLDTEPLYRIVWKRAAAECGYILTDDAYRGLVGRGRKTAEQVLSRMAGPDFPLEKFRNLSRDAEVRAFSVEPVSKKPGLDELLSLVESRNLPKAVATSTERSIAIAASGKNGAAGSVCRSGDGRRGRPRKTAPGLIPACGAPDRRLPPLFAWSSKIPKPAPQPPLAPGCTYTSCRIW